MKLCYSLIQIIFITLPITSYSDSFLEKLPNRITNSTVQEQANWLNQIAVFTYQTLLDVPQQGLRTKRAEIEQVIAVRQWLESQRLPLFQLLAIQLQGLVDRAIFNEFDRAARTNQGTEVFTPFVPNSFDNSLLSTLLQANAVPKEAWMKYALTLDGDIINFPKNHSSKVLTFFLRGYLLFLHNYLDGNISLSSERRSYITDLEYIKNKRIRAMYNGLQSFTQDEIGDFIFIITLRAIDSARDTRLIADLFIKQKGELDGTSAEFKQDLEEELTLLYGDEQHRTQNNISSGLPINAFSVLRTTNEYREKNATSYGAALTRILFRFFNNADWQKVADKYKQYLLGQDNGELLTEYFGTSLKPGCWLQLQLPPDKVQSTDHDDDFLETLPSYVTMLSAEEQANWLNQVAVFTYHTLLALDVPRQGLQHTKRTEIERIIAVRQWLETQHLPLFQLLAIQLQQFIDQAIFHEIYLANIAKLRAKATSSTTPATDSLDDDSLNALLQANAVPEMTWIKYVLTLDGEVISFLKNYQERIFMPSDYLDGTIWPYIPNEQRYPLHPDYVNTKETALMYDGWKQLTQDKIGDFLFIKTLQAIDAARDVRLITQLLIKRNGDLTSFGSEAYISEETVEEEMNLLYGDEQHRTQRRVSQGALIRSNLVMDTIEEYLKVMDYYNLDITWRLFKFFTEADWQTVKDKYKQTISMSTGFITKQLDIDIKPGCWLQLQSVVTDKIQ